MYKMYFASFVLVVFLGSEKATCVPANELLDVGGSDWDILIFTQHWPITVCYEWKEKETNNICSFPTLRDIWTVHGIWPTKLGTKGPLFCNKTWNFDPDQISPFEKQLQIFWLNIEKNTPARSFWKHEWVKHGTCAAQISDLDNEAKYFQQGLNWINKYDMQSVLSKSGILPNKTHGYGVEEIYNAVQSVLHARPAVECIHSKATGQSMISEIRICFNKSLDLVDCDGIRDPYTHVFGDIITSCPLKRPVIYPSVVPLPPTRKIYDHPVPWQLNLYRFLQFLIWFTL